MAAPTKTQKLKSKILAEVERWTGIAEEIPFLDKLGDLDEAVKRGEKTKAEVEAQVAQLEGRRDALLKDEAERRKALEEEISTARRKVDENLKMTTKARKEAEDALKVSEAGAKARADEVLAEARAEAKRIIANELDKFAKRKSLLEKAVEELEAKVASLQKEETTIQASIKKAMDLRKKLTALESI